MTNKISILFMILLLSGCAEYGALKSVGKQAAQDISDESLRISLWNICEGASIGSLDRWIGSD